MTFSRLKVNLSYMTVQNTCITFTIVVDPLPAFRCFPIYGPHLRKSL